MRISLFLLLVIFLPALSHAQTVGSAVTPDQYIIDTIVVIGNEKTRESVILREMSLKVGSPVTTAALAYDRGRIYSLGLFNRVDIYFQPFEGQHYLIIDVSERWYIIPVPLFGFRDGDTKRAYYGAAVLHNNFRGLNQKLLGSIVVGYDPSLSFRFSDPHIDPKNDLYLSTGFSFSRIRNKSTRATMLVGDFNEFHYDINATLGKRFSLYEHLGLTLGYTVIKVNTFMPGRTVSGDGVDRFITAGLNYRYDSRDLQDFPSHGRMVNIELKKMGFGENELSITRLRLDAREFIPLPADFVLGTRVHTTLSRSWSIPTHSRVYFGYGERIRGHFRTTFEGDNLLGGSVELRYPLLPPQTFTFTAIPLPPEFSVWRFGIGLTLFADAGKAWSQHERLAINSFATGYGAGIMFLLPYDFIVRTEYALNQFGKGEFILDARASF